ncbi:MAG: EamA family transporter [Bacteroidota bacterium]
MRNKSPLFYAYVAFALVSFFWGTTYLGIRIGVRSIPPFWLAGLRQTAAGLLVIVYCLFRGTKLPAWKEYSKTIVPGLLMIAAGNGLVTWAEQNIESGLAAILCSMNPVWVMLLTWIFVQKETFDRKLIMGVALGFVGILVIFSNSLSDFTDPRYISGIIAIVLANIGWAAGTLYVSKVKTGLSPVYAAGWQMFTAGLVLAAISFITEKPFETEYTTEGVLALVYLTIFGSIVAYGAFLYVLKHLSATKASAYAYINTVVAVLLGWMWLGEQITLNIILGTLITIYGIYLVNSKKRGRVEEVAVSPVNEP